MAYKPIESYGVIGDLHTVALVGMNGSIDWCGASSLMQVRSRRLVVA